MPTLGRDGQEVMSVELEMVPKLEVISWVDESLGMCCSEMVVKRLGSDTGSCLHQSEMNPREKWTTLSDDQRQAFKTAYNSRSLTNRLCLWTYRYHDNFWCKPSENASYTWWRVWYRRRLSWSHSRQSYRQEYRNGCKEINSCHNYPALAASSGR
ncbi:hypothetical protein AMATHDRAFT_61543 [Amanita thiersii Skay4041]|uniref:Uncharacterized protein n=1 Tax=Amanita thiersii Skay4041 TaxID=703135 RepID=A0A2A9NGS4_9AGAR|nr:hypothetical protein AMATHDRAFT_61543 [Amanita thiersii Skay4041]